MILKLGYKFFVLVLVVLIIINTAGCSAPTPEAPSATIAATKAITIPTKTSTTRISLPTNTPTSLPTETLTPLRPQDFDASNIKTLTPASPALCPITDSSLEFDVASAQKGSGTSESIKQFTEYVLSYLNAGGTTKSILPAYEKFYGRQIKPFFQVREVTGDTVPELVFPFGVWLDIFGCENGKYKLLSTVADNGAFGGSRIFDITDTNGNGLDEIVAWFDGCMGNRCPAINVYEWNGNEFQELMVDVPPDNSCKNLSLAPFEVKIRDIDNNGTNEIILSNNYDPWPDDLEFPYRKETRICMWNGQNFVVYKTNFETPYYRFQAVQDGDRATLAGDYDKALVFYQRTINDKKLQWFTENRKWYDFWVYQSKYFSTSFNEPAPLDPKSLAEDPSEYPNIAAYAYYRMMLLYILQNDTAKAESTFSLLQSQFPKASPGNYFMQVASVFWQEYQHSIKIQDSCRKVIEYAQEHPIPIEYLGDWNHGAQSIDYKPESICPFR
ncbi:MAG: hypothetical protein HZB50_04200 [Chloroflexi bacterium]|nr:hypothetical protein [Chloroflexota bacterium]